MWFWWAFGGAIISSISVTYNKRVLTKEVSPSVVSFFLFLTVTVFSLPLLIFNNGSNTNEKFWLAIAISALTFSFAKTIQLGIFKKNNLSDVYPLNALQPVTIYILSFVILSEVIKLTAIGGILLMAIGIYVLNYNYHDKNPFHPFIVFAKNKVSQLYVLTLILANISTIAQKVAIENTFPQNLYPLGFWENFLLTIITGIYILKTNKNWKKEIKENFFFYLLLE